MGLTRGCFFTAALVFWVYRLAYESFDGKVMKYFYHEVVSLPQHRGFGFFSFYVWSTPLQQQARA